MKTNKFKRLVQKNLLIGLCALFLIACSKDDGEPVVIFKYASETYEVNYQVEGSIPAPTINWPGAKGTFALKNAIEGLIIDTETGVISIEKSLAIGVHEIVVYATNEKGTWITDFTLNYTIKSALLVGAHINHPNSNLAIAIDRSLILNEDGTLSSMVQEDSLDFFGIGVWTLEDDTFKMHLCYSCKDMDPQAIPEYDEHAYYEGTLAYREDDGASIKGQWYIVRFDPDSTNLRGDFVFLWDRD